jgi:hypothetical protein
MASLNGLQQFFFGRQLKEHNSYSKSGQLKSVVSTALFLLPPKHINDLDRLKAWCKEQNIGIQHLDIICFSEDKSEEENVVGSQMVTWFKGLKRPVLETIKQKHYDLLVNLDDGYNRPMLLATAAVDADFKVGFLANSIKVYHLLLEDHGSSLSSKLGAIDQVFQMIAKK